MLQKITLVKLEIIRGIVRKNKEKKKKKKRIENE
jgi:hypothetical protein